MDSLLKDIRYAIRMLAKSPGFTLAAVLALALGIGANSAIFSVVNAVLLRPLPYERPDQLVHVFRTQPPIMTGPISRPDYFEWEAQAKEFSGIAAFTYWSYNISGTDEAERVSACRVTQSFFPLFGVPAAQGRFFLPEEDQAGGAPVAVISFGLWQRRFGADPKVIGASILLNGEPNTIVGVAPAGFEFPHRVDVWTLLRLVEQKQQRGSNYLQVIARLHEGTSTPRAEAQMNQVAAGLAQRFPENDTNLTVTVMPILEAQVRDIRANLLILLGAVGFVLLIACANVANLMLARATAREREIAIRTALGGSRVRIIRQLLTESVLLGLVGGSLGLGLAWCGIKVLVRVAPPNLPRVAGITIDPWVLGFTAVAAVLTGIVFGLVPALQISRPNLVDALKEGTRTAGSQKRNRLRSALVVVEVAMSMLLLVGAALLIESERKLGEVNPGFDPTRQLTADVSFPRQVLQGTDDQRDRKELEETSAFLGELTRRLSAIPGVEAAGAINDLPVTGYGSINGSIKIEGQPEPRPGEEPVAEYRWVTADYFRAIGIPLLEGRAFSDADQIDHPIGILVNQSLARKFFAGESAVGHRISALDGKPHEILGVVGDARQWGLARQPDPEIYFSYSQVSGTDPTLVVRTSGDPASLAGTVRRIVGEVNHDAPVYRIKTMMEVVATSMARQRFNALLMTTFAVVALLLAGIGLYGVISYSVSQKTREIGIRMALGASRGSVMKLVVGRGMLLSGVGVGVGVCGALYLSRFLESLLFGVSATDLATFAVISTALSIIALLACAVPAGRATRVNPVVALREE